MNLRAAIPVLAVLAIGCAPSVAPISEGAIEHSELRYRLVLEQTSSSEAAARMGLAIERALAARGILRAAEWEEATLTVRFAMVEQSIPADLSPSSQYGLDPRVWDRNGEYACTADHCSMAYWTPMMPVAVRGTVTSGAVAIRIVAADGSRELWTGTHLEPVSWTRVGQRRADEIAREMTRSLLATDES